MATTQTPISEKRRQSETLSTNGYKKETRLSLTLTQKTPTRTTKRWNSRSWGAQS